MECKENFVKIKSGGHFLPGIFHLSSKHSKVIVLLHGFTGNKIESGRLYVNIARKLCDNGYNVLRFDYRCHGDAPLPFEDFRISFALEDAFNAIKFAKSSNSTDLGLVGLSMGGGIGVKVASEVKEIKTLVLLSPALDFPRLVSRGRGEIREGYAYFGAFRMKLENLQELSKFSVMDLANNIKIPILIIHSIDDQVVPISQSKAFYEGLKVKKNFIETRGGHVFNNYAVRERIINEIIKWFKEYL